jgi:hypothetical protein
MAQRWSDVSFSFGRSLVGIDPGLGFDESAIAWRSSMRAYTARSYSAGHFVRVLKPEEFERLFRELQRDIRRLKWRWGVDETRLRVRPRAVRFRAPFETLWRRLGYGGRKGRRAHRRLMSMPASAWRDAFT